MTPEEEACLGFSYLYGVGPYKFSQLVHHFSSAQIAYTASEKDLLAFTNDKRILSLIEFRRKFNVVATVAMLQQQQISYVALCSPSYPTILKNIADPPIGLFCKGNLSLLSESGIRIAIVGTRKPSSYGQIMAKRFSRELARQGIVIVSGLALGIDACAHVGAIEEQGNTIAVLGCGVDIVYPQANSILYENILTTNNLILSEFPPGLTVLPGLFVARNRIISGLSKGVLVVEGSMKSGSLITASYAANQGRDIFAIPGQINVEGAAAPLLLLKQGAHLVTESADIITELGLVPRTTGTRVDNRELSRDERQIVSLLQLQPLPTDALLKQCGLPLSTLMFVLSALELGGIMVKGQDGCWQLT